MSKISTMPVASALAAFHTHVEARLHGLGFRRETNDGEIRYWRRGPVRGQVMGFHVWDRYNELTLYPGAAVRFEQVEQVLAAVPGAPPDPTRDISTLSARLEDTLQHLRNGLDLKGDEASLAAAKTAFDDVLRAAVIFFDRFTKLTDVDAVLNANPDRPSEFIHAPYERCCRGVVAAKLVGRSDLSSLIAKYRQNLTVVSDGFFLRKFQRVIDHIERMH